MQQAQKESDDFFWETVKFIWKYRKWLLGVFFITGVFTYIILRFAVTPKYETEAIIYPANVIPVSNENPTEQAVQMLNSGDIRWKIIDSFNLIEHYELNEQRYSGTDLGNLYDEHISIEPTSYASISIVVKDQDPKIAAQIANAIVELLTVKMLAIKQEKFSEWAQFYKQKYEDKDQRIKGLEQKLTELRQKNKILNFEEQSAALIHRMSQMEEQQKNAETRITYFKNNYVVGKSDSIKKYEIKRLNATNRLEEMRPQFDKMLNVGDEIVSLRNTIELELESLSEYKAEYEEAQQNAQRKISYAYPITTAGPPDKPKYPRKSLLTLLVAFSSVLALCFGIVFYRRVLYLQNKFKA